MIWLRLLIAVIALTISSDLSAWAQPQMQVNSPEGFYDCNGIANGTNERDPVNDCCFRSQMVFCGGCKDNRRPCEKDLRFGCGTPANPDNNGTCCFDNQKVCGKCYYTKQGCESTHGCGTSVTDVGCGCGNPKGACGCNLSIVDRGCGCGKPAPGECGCNLSVVKVCDTCGGTMGGCGRCSGCRSCDVSRCQDPGTGCNPAYQCSGSTRIGHGARAVRIGHISPVRGSGYLYSTNPDAEPPLAPGGCVSHSRANYICNDGTMVPG